jgi:hypothetical protein
MPTDDQSAMTAHNTALAAHLAADEKSKGDMTLFSGRFERGAAWWSNR